MTYINTSPFDDGEEGRSIDRECSQNANEDSCIEDGCSWNEDGELSNCKINTFPLHLVVFAASMLLYGLSSMFLLDNDNTRRQVNILLLSISILFYAFPSWFLKKNQYVDLNGSESLPTIFIIASIALIVRNLAPRVGVKSN
tara:strand:+ start:200 stop:625 length:426 start_codon:yes stop_codon:yes gene_type:complete